MPLGGESEELSLPPWAWPNQVCRGGCGFLPKPQVATTPPLRGTLGGQSCSLEGGLLGLGFLACHQLPC